MPRWIPRVWLKNMSLVRKINGMGRRVSVEAASKWRVGAAKVVTNAGKGFVGNQR
jgi:hypothetical protein